MYRRLPQVANISHYIQKPILDDCYICLDPISDKLMNGAVIPYQCRHPICVICVNCVRKPNNTNTITFAKLSFCGICRAKPNRYITECQYLCKIPYSDNQSIFVPTDTINDDTLYRDHIQHMIAHSY